LISPIATVGESGLTGGGVTPPPLFLEQAMPTTREIQAEARIVFLKKNIFTDRTFN
jgi:hypothetical protein